MNMNKIGGTQLFICQIMLVQMNKYKNKKSNMKNSKKKMKNRKFYLSKSNKNIKKKNFP